MDFSAYAYTSVYGRDFEGQTVDLDGNFYTRCRFVGAHLVFRGEAPFCHANCEWDSAGTKVIVDGRARMIMAVLAGLLTDDSLLALATAVRNDVTLPTRLN